MFTGIIECLGTITHIEQELANYHYTIESAVSAELQVDQSVAHDGVCLTVTRCDSKSHTVTAIKETMDKTSLSAWSIGDPVNIERCMVMNGRLDGHIVQGHVDTTGTCVNITETEGSWLYTIEYPIEHDALVIRKGSICINGASLTVVNPTKGRFSVAIIPYTYEHTTFKALKAGDAVNLEFDILGKYIQKNLSILKT